MHDQGSIFEAASVDRVRRALKIDPTHVRRLKIQLLKHFDGVDEALASLPQEVRLAFKERIRLSALRLDKRFDSSIDGATKLIFRTEGGYAIESVILRAATGRTALCVSSQVGCAAACDFCATGRMGIAKNLDAFEILDQVLQANRLLRAESRQVRNIVFMGMGEPFHNADALHAALATLQDGACFNHAPSRVLVSTVGIPDAMLLAAERFPKVNYALSLHSADQETRERIIPLARRHPLDELRETVAELNRIQPARTSVMLEHLMLRGVNDSLDHADRLVDWTRGLRVHVNLIPYNAVDEAPHLTGSSRSVIERFGDRVRSSGVPTTIRYSMGADIAAACGQLVKHENRTVARSLHAAPPPSRVDERQSSSTAS